MPNFQKVDVKTAKSFIDFAKDKCEITLELSQFFSLGNLHLVLHQNKLKHWEFFKFASSIQNVLDGINVHMIQENQTSQSQVEVIVYERGVGATPACGSGACAVAKFLNPNGTQKIKMPGGVLEVDLKSESPQLKGPAKFVFSGEIEPSHFN